MVVGFTDSVPFLCFPFLIFGFFCGFGAVCSVGGTPRYRGDFGARLGRFFVLWLRICDFYCWVNSFSPFFVIPCSDFWISFAILVLFVPTVEPPRFRDDLELVWALFFFAVASDLCV